MTSKRITTVLGQLGLTQVRYVSPVRRGAAQGLAGRVYDQVEREFGVLGWPGNRYSRTVPPSPSPTRGCGRSRRGRGTAGPRKAPCCTNRNIPPGRRRN
jgi:hypothetical protein